MSTVIYNCKRCKLGKRVEYPNKMFNCHTRIDSNGNAQPAAVWIQASGGGKPTVYGGDVEMGICSSCGKMMDFGVLIAHLRPEVKCSAICTGARGHVCNCSCGGTNHGCAA